jgi:uncharacterized protein YqeY
VPPRAPTRVAPPLTTLRERIQGDLKSALKAGRKDAVRTLRMLEAALKNKQIELRRPLTDPEVVQAVQAGIKQRRESIAQYAKGGRADLVAQEEEEAAVLALYLPAQLSEAELDALVQAAVTEVGATGPKDLGAVMKRVMAEAQGRAEGARINAAVRARLA